MTINLSPFWIQLTTDLECLINAVIEYVCRLWVVVTATLRLPLGYLCRLSDPMP